MSPDTGDADDTSTTELGRPKDSEAIKLIGDVCSGALGFDSRDRLSSEQPEACEL